MISASAWVILTLAAPVAARAGVRRMGRRLADWEAEVAFWAQAAYGVLPLYGAWISGAVIGRDCGLSGFSSAEWLRGLLVCGLLLGALAFSLQFVPVAPLVRTWFWPSGSWLVLFDEPRWAFYRGAAAVHFPNLAVAQAIGLLLGGLEWLIRTGPPVRHSPPQAWSGLVRLGVSAGLFALTHNLWLILLSQAAAAALVKHSRTGESTPA